MLFWLKKENNKRGGAFPPRALKVFKKKIKKGRQAPTFFMHANLLANCLHKNINVVKCV